MTVRISVAVFLLVGVVVGLPACGGGKPAAPAGQTAASTPAAEAAKPGAPLDKPLDDLQTELPEGVRANILKPFTGDLDEMVKRRLVRVGVTYNRTFYFVDRGVQRGVSYDYGRMVEERLNKKFNPENKNDEKIHVFFVPLPREKLLGALTEGQVDLVAAQATVRPELQKYVTFSNPTRTNVSEILVTGPGASPIASVDDLSGKAVFARKNSAYEESLLALNEKFKAAGKPPVEIKPAPDNLEDDDLLEMVNAGLLQAIVVDDYLAKFWKQVFPNLTIHENVAVRTGGSIAVGVRQNCPKTVEALNTFMGNYGLGTAFGNQIERKYLASTKYVKSAASEAERKKFMAIVQLFKKYGEKYDLDFLLMAAQGYQESQLNQEAKSQVGAIGIMQVMPETGKELKVGDITKVEPNIHAGVKYMRQNMNTFFANEPMTKLDKGLFTFAAYNAGPGRIQQLRRVAAQRGLDPNVWFGNVEQIASEKIGRETVTYVSNIYKYYVAYRLVMEENARRTATKAQLQASSKPEAKAKPEATAKPVVKTKKGK